MKKIIIAALMGSMIALTGCRSEEPTAKTNLVMSDDNGTYLVVPVSDTLSDEDINVAQIMDVQDTISEMLSELDWIDHAEVAISGSDKDLFVAAVLTVNRDPSSDDAEDAAYVISQYVENAENTDILITDQNSNVIYPVSE